MPRRLARLRPRRQSRPGGLWRAGHDILFHQQPPAAFLFGTLLKPIDDGRLDLVPSDAFGAFFLGWRPNPDRAHAAIQPSIMITTLNSGSCSRVGGAGSSIAAAAAPHR